MSDDSILNTVLESAQSAVAAGYPGSQARGEAGRTPCLRSPIWLPQRERSLPRSLFFFLFYKIVCSARDQVFHLVKAQPALQGAEVRWRTPSTTCRPSTGGTSTPSTPWSAGSAGPVCVFAHLHRFWFGPWSITSSLLFEAEDQNQWYHMLLTLAKEWRHRISKYVSS